MTQAPGSPESDHTHEAQRAAAMSAAARVLARLLARHAAGEFLRDCAQEEHGNHHDPQDDHAG